MSERSKKGNFKGMIKGNMIKDFPVTVEDVDVAEKIWGPDISYLKGRTVRRMPRAIINRTMEIPRELKENCARVILHMDILYISGSGFLTTIGHPMYYKTCVLHYAAS